MLRNLSTTSLTCCSAPPHAHSTGGSGFLGSMTVKLCLQRGWIVKTTTRNPKKHSKRLHNLVPTKSHNLTIHQLDFLAPTAEDDLTNIFQECDVIMHTASPFFVKGATLDNVVKPAVEGTRKVLNSASKANVQNIILTSSTASIYAWYGNKPLNHIMTEEDWSNEQALLDHSNYYPISKMRAEKLAWTLSKQLNLNLAVMNPCLIWYAVYNIYLCFPFHPLIFHQKLQIVFCII